MSKPDTNIQHTSAEYFAELSTTELVMLKDAIDVEVERLERLAKEHTDDPDRYPQARVFAGWARTKRDLSFKMGVIIEARLHEERVYPTELNVK